MFRHKNASKPRLRNTIIFFYDPRKTRRIGSIDPSIFGRRQRRPLSLSLRPSDYLGRNRVKRSALRTNTSSNSVSFVYSFGRDVEFFLLGTSIEVLSMLMKSLVLLNDRRCHFNKIQFPTRRFIRTKQTRRICRRVLKLFSISIILIKSLRCTRDARA